MLSLSYQIQISLKIVISSGVGKSVPLATTGKSVDLYDIAGGQPGNICWKILKVVYIFSGSFKTWI